MNKNSIPNRLFVTIQTNIPGYQILTYSSEFSIPNDNKKENILFTPIFPLKKSVIDAVPENLKIEEFFNKGLFQSLIFSHGNQSQPLSLLDATKTGIVDNNIQITLDTLFSTNNSFFINKEIYTIANYRWTKGDWRINRKPIDFSEIPNQQKNTKYWNKYIKNRILLGEKQFRDLPEEVLFGSTYEKKDLSTLNLGPEIIPVSEINAGNVINNNQNPVSEEIKPVTEFNNVPVTEFNNVPVTEIPKPITETPKLEPETITNFQILSPPNLKIEEQSTTKLRDYFDNPKYYFMMKEIIQNMNLDQQKIILKSYSKLVHFSNIVDKNYYSELVQQIQVEKNKGEGDCFFIALADAINLYNSQQNNDFESNRITYNNYGIFILFTQKALKTMIANFILNPEKWDFYQSIGQKNANHLNELFQKEIGRKEKKDKYMDLLEKIYLSNHHFLVTKPNFVPTDSKEYENPFQPTNPSNTRIFIEGKEYETNKIMIDIINQILFLNIIVFEYNNNQSLLPFLFPNFKKENSFPKSLFLYYENHHYELVTFSYPNSLKKSIFDSNTQPPLYLLYLLFGSYYIQLSNQEKQSILLFKTIMEIFQESFQNIYLKQEKENKINQNSNEMNFLLYFNEYFNQHPNSLLNQEFPLLDQPIKGGAEREENLLGYFITIELWMKKGEEIISPKELKKINCNQKWSDVEKAYAKFTRKKYVMKPNYNLSYSNKNKTQKQKQKPIM